MGAGIGDFQLAANGRADGQRRGSAGGTAADNSGCL